VKLKKNTINSFFLFTITEQNTHISVNKFDFNSACIIDYCIKDNIPSDVLMYVHVLHICPEMNEIGKKIA
jgi:hypothetical protein